MSPGIVIPVVIISIPVLIPVEPVVIITVIEDGFIIPGIIIVIPHYLPIYVIIKQHIMWTLIVMESDQSPGQWILINIFHFYCCIQVKPLCRDLHKGHHH